MFRLNVIPQLFKATQMIAVTLAHMHAA